MFCPEDIKYELEELIVEDRVQLRNFLREIVSLWKVNCMRAASEYMLKILASSIERWARPACSEELSFIPHYFN